MGSRWCWLYAEASCSPDVRPGHFVEGAYVLDSVDDKSLLRTKIGLQQGDQVISVNGHPVGNSVSAGRGLYEQLKSERRFAIKVRRKGQETILSYYAN